MRMIAVDFIVGGCMFTGQTVKGKVEDARFKGLLVFEGEKSEV